MKRTIIEEKKVFMIRGIYIIAVHGKYLTITEKGFVLCKYMS